jgi:UDP-N-acetylglucosamine 2-epimerase
MPEEINRVVTDHLSTLLFTPSETAVKNLAAEGIVSGVVQTGDVMIDALKHVVGDAPSQSPIAQNLRLSRDEYYVATIHRAATTDDPTRLAQAMALLAGLDLPVIVPLHPRTKSRLEELGNEIDLPQQVHITSPTGYGEMMRLVANARAVLTDSGGLQKEAYYLGIRCVTLRSTTEWQETVDTGWNSIVDLNLDLTRQTLAQPLPQTRPALYGDGEASRLIALALSHHQRPQ